MSAVLLALALAVQPQPQQPSAPPQPPLRADGPPSRELSPAHDIFYDEMPLSPPARSALHRFGSCVAARSTERAGEALRTESDAPSYGPRISRLARANERCFRGRGRMSFSNLLLAGSMAEALIERDPQPLNVRLARAALRPPSPVRPAGDRVATCIVRSLPDEVGALMATDVSSAEEEAAIAALAPAAEACAGNRRVEANVAGWRAILARAAYRSLDSAEAHASAQRD